MTGETLGIWDTGRETTREGGLKASLTAKAFPTVTGNRRQATEAREAGTYLRVFSGSVELANSAGGLDSGQLEGVASLLAPGHSETFREEVLWFLFLFPG